MDFNFFRKKYRPRAGSPDYWRDYLACFGHAYGRRSPLDEVRFVVFDTEATGLDIRKGHLLSLGAVSVSGWQISLEDSLELYIRQDYAPVEAAIAVHGILPGGRQGSLSEEEAVIRFLAYCRHAVLVGHHIDFDAGLINKSLYKMTGGKLLNKRLDTAALALRLAGPGQVRQQGAFSLDNLCRQYHIPMSDRHTAAGDAFITAILFLKLLARLEKRGVRTLGRLL